ncbi:zinc finger protein 260-like isoform X2 [Artemia franciscana]|uniref:zinc finger protein 260-like isoform X2 n=1 Tax=Artemia franciscana TaxID=6661 RepID=UPI0032D9EF9F
MGRKKKHKGWERIRNWNKSRSRLGKQVHGQASNVERSLSLTGASTSRGTVCLTRGLRDTSSRLARKYPKSIQRNEADDGKANEESPSSFSCPGSNSACPSREIESNDGFIYEKYNGLETTFLSCNNESNQDYDIYHGTDKIENRNDEIGSLCERVKIEADSLDEGHYGDFLWERVEMGDQKKENTENTDQLGEAIAAKTDPFSEGQHRRVLRVKAERVDHINRCPEGADKPSEANAGEEADHKNGTQEEMDSLDKTINAETDSLAKDQQFSFSFNKVTDISGNDLEYKLSGADNQPRTDPASRLYGTCPKVGSLPSTEQSIYTCRKCDKSFFGRSNLITHLRTHYDDESFECNLCKKRYTEQRKLDVHAQRCIGNTFQCEICGKMFTKRSSLNYHLKTHTDQRTFKCEVCQKLFRCAKTLKKHSVVHMKDRVKSFGCQLCNKRYYSGTGLRTHMVVHTGDKKHQCFICNKRFGSRNELSRHMLVHKCEQPFKCEVCTAPFSRKDNYVTHMRLHSGTKPFECQVCHKTFAQSAGLSMHKKMHRDKTSKGK